MKRIILVLLMSALMLVGLSLAQLDDSGTNFQFSVTPASRGQASGDEVSSISLSESGDILTGDRQITTDVDSGGNISSWLISQLGDTLLLSGWIGDGTIGLSNDGTIDSGVKNTLASGLISNLILSEVYYDGTDEWIEITNIGDGNFQWNLILSGVKSTAVSLTNISIASGESKIFGDNWAQISGTSFIGKTGLSLSITDTASIAIRILISGQIVDSLLVDEYRVNKYNDKKTSFEKVGGITTRVQADRKANMQSGYTGNPGIYFSTGVDIIDVSIPPPAQSWISLQIPISCDSLAQTDLVKINEVFPWNEKYPAYIELAVHSLTGLDSLSLSGSLLTTGIDFLLGSWGTTLGNNTILLITASGLWENEGMTTLQNNDFSLLGSWDWLIIYGGSGQSRRVLDIVYISGNKAGKSWYYWATSYQCARILDTLDDFSPGFERKFLKYFPVSTVTKIEYIQVITGTQAWTGDCSKPSTSTLLSWNSESSPDISLKIAEYTIHILAIDYDPKGADTNNEKITLLASNSSGDSTPLNLSKDFRLKVNGRNKTLSGMLEMEVPTTFTKTFGFPNSTDSWQDVVVSLTYKDYVYDTYTYNPKKLSSQDEEALTTTGYYVSSVIDGDTFRIKYQGKTQSIRLLGVDAPESTKTRYKYLECFGTQAKDHLKSLLDKKKITFQFDPSQDQKDIYDRLLAYVFIEDENINQTMIEDGYAKEYTYKTPYLYQSSFKQAEQSAQEQRLGLWNESTCGVWLSGIQLTGNIETTGDALSLSGLKFSISYVIPNPKGTDKSEELWLLIDYGTMEQWKDGGVMSGESSKDYPLKTKDFLDLSQGFTLRVGKSKKKIKENAVIGQENILSWSLGLVNKAACVSLFYEEQELTKFCYGKPKEGEKIYASASWLEETSEENLGILNLLQLKRVGNTLCIDYQNQSFLCKRIPASKAETKTVNEKNLYKGFASLIKQYLMASRRDLYYDTPFKAYFDRLSQNNKLIGKWMSHIDIYGQRVLLSNIKAQLETLKNTLPSVVAVFEGERALYGE